MCLHLVLEERDSSALCLACLVSRIPYTPSLLCVPDSLEAVRAGHSGTSHGRHPPDHARLHTGHSFLGSLDLMLSSSTVASTLETLPTT